MSDANYNKIKHLVEVDDDILAVFTVSSGRQKQMENLSIAENANITKEFVDYIFARLQCNHRSAKEDTDKKVGKLKWTINENEHIRTLIIYENDRLVIVLIKSNKSLSETVDNILGYYYELESPS
ncbi:MAG TPA: hypothetical protein VD710_04105 [Nitrososphaeraceae archaeon]|nr:hypothetical protein [Nitrososphaeraceae archaeon]